MSSEENRGKKEAKQIKASGFRNNILRNDEGTLNGFQTKFETFFSYRTSDTNFLAF